MQCFSGFLFFDSVGCGVVVPEVLVRVLDFVVRYKGGNFIGPLAVAGYDSPERALVYTYVLVCAEDSVPIKWNLKCATNVNRGASFFCRMVDAPRLKGVVSVIRVPIIAAYLAAKRFFPLGRQSFDKHCNDRKGFHFCCQNLTLQQNSTIIMQPLHCDLQPQIPKHPITTHARTIAQCRTPCRNQSHVKATPAATTLDKLPFIAGCSHFTQKNTRFRAPASFPTQAPLQCASQHHFGLHACIPMRFASDVLYTCVIGPFLKQKIWNRTNGI